MDTGTLQSIDYQCQVILQCLFFSLDLKNKAQLQLCVVRSHYLRRMPTHCTLSLRVNGGNVMSRSIHETLPIAPSPATQLIDSIYSVYHRSYGIDGTTSWSRPTIRIDTLSRIALVMNAYCTP